MDQPRYDIIFTGKLQAGTNPEQAQASLAKLFNTSPDNVAKLFNGKPQRLKRGVDKTAAIKYKAALHKAGLVIAFKQTLVEEATGALAAAQPAAKATPSNSAPPAAAPSALSLAPSGSEVLTEDERHDFVPRDVDTSAIQLVSPFLEPQQDDPVPPPPPPSTQHISIAEAGADLNPDRPAPAQPPELHLDDISVAPVGAELEEIHPDLPIIDPDISHIDLAEAGSDLREGQPPKAVPPAPDTSHLSVSGS